MDRDIQVGISIHGVFDHQREAVGLTVSASDSFDDSSDTRAKVEVLAAITAKANAMAAEIIRTWEPSQERRNQLFDHYASLKEHMLKEMLEQLDRADTP